jgi:hypothetical protein
MRGWLVLCLVGCSFHTHAPGGDDDDAPAVGVAWTLDTAEDFAGSGYQAQAVTIEPAGMLTQAAYAYGGLLLHGVHGMELWVDPPLDWNLVSTVTPGGAALWTGDDFDTSQDLANVGIATNDVFTL